MSAVPARTQAQSPADGAAALPTLPLLSLLDTMPGPSHAARRRKLYRHYDRWQRQSPELFAAPTAKASVPITNALKLPDGTGVADWHRAHARPDVVETIKVPDSVRSDSDAQRSRRLAEAQVAAWYNDFLRERPSLAPSSPATFAEFGRVYGERVRGLARRAGCKLGCTKGAIAKYRRTIDGTRRIARMGRPKKPAGERAETCSPEAIERAVQVWGNQNRPTLAGVYSFVAAEAKEHGWTVPSAKTFARYLWRRLPPLARRFLRGSARDFEAECEPKVTRDRSDTPAGEEVTWDCTRMDVWCASPDSRGGMKSIRPTLSIFSDERTGKILGWSMGANESASVILGSFKVMLREHGAPLRLAMDNGPAMRRLFSPKGTDVSAICEFFGIRVSRRRASKPWGNSQECNWSILKPRFERQQASYAGNGTERKPDSALYYQKRPDKCPTIEQLSAEFAAFVELHNNTTRHSSGTNGMTPDQAFETVRGRVRRVSDNLIWLLCTVPAGERVVSNRGVCVDGIQYGAADLDVLKLYGQRVQVRRDPEMADYVMLCNEQGEPITTAHNRVLDGATEESRKEAFRLKKRIRNAAKEVARAGTYLFKPASAQVIEVQRKRAMAQAEHDRRVLGEPDKPEVSIVLPALTDAADRVRDRVDGKRGQRVKAENAFDRLPASRPSSAPGAACDTDDTVADEDETWSLLRKMSEHHESERLAQEAREDEECSASWDTMEIQIGA